MDQSTSILSALSYPSSVERSCLLWNNEHYKKHQDLRKNTNMSDVHSEAFNKLSEWNPITENSDRNFSDLQKRFTPATIEDGKLFRINDIGVDIFKTSYLIKPKLEEELINVAPIGHFLTYHLNSFCMGFIPTVSEVLKQLPQQTIETKGDFYFTVHVIVPEDYSLSTIGPFLRYHIGITTVFTANKKE